MIDFLWANWGSLASVVGVVLSLGGLGWAIKEARGAKSASRAAQMAANETRDQIALHLRTVQLERAIGLIQVIKSLHNSDGWVAARELYQVLRTMLSEIIARCSENQTEFRERLANDRIIVKDIENLVDEHINQGIEDSRRANINRQLNEIQSDLEDLANEDGFGGPRGEAK